MDPDRNELRLVAVDDAGDIWILVRQGDIVKQALNVWVKVVPPHP